MPFWCGIRDAELYWKIMVVVVFGPLEKGEKGRHKGRQRPGKADFQEAQPGNSHTFPRICPKPKTREKHVRSRPLTSPFVPPLFGSPTPDQETLLTHKKSSRPDPGSVDFGRESPKFRFEFCCGFLVDFFLLFFQRTIGGKIHQKNPHKIHSGLCSEKFPFGFLQKPFLEKSRIMILLQFAFLMRNCSKSRCTPRGSCNNTQLLVPVRKSTFPAIDSCNAHLIGG